MYALVDCNSFYASCEQVFRPDLKDKAVVVLSNNDGCIIARNRQAKAMDVLMGIPAYQVRHLLKRDDVAVFSSNYTLYGDMSNRVMQVLYRYTPEVEHYSIDEAFLGLKGFPADSLEPMAHELRATIERETGIPTSVGVAPTKALSKIANRVAKKRNCGVFVIHDTGSAAGLLADFPLSDVWGIGRRYLKFLEQHGIATVGEFTQASGAWVQKHMTVVGLRLWQELNGYPCLDIEQEMGPRKAICTSRSFKTLLNNYAPIEEAVCNYTVRCAEKLRRQKSCARILLVFLETNPHRKEHRQHRGSQVITLPNATNDSVLMTTYARAALRRLYRRGHLYKKAGVMVMEIVPQDAVQGNMFYQPRTRQNQLMEEMDTLNQRYGTDKVRLAAQGYDKTWKLRCEMRSPRYTTRMDEILEVQV